MRDEVSELLVGRAPVAGFAVDAVRRRVWFPRSISALEPALASLDPAIRARLDILVSHDRPDAPVLGAADAGLVEPAGLTSTAYVEWMLRTARAHAIDTVVAGVGTRRLAEAAERFRAEGIVLRTPGDPATIATLSDKLATLARAAQLGVATVPARRVASLADWAAATAEFAADPDALLGGLCLKPITGIYGAGFRRVRAEGEASAWTRLGQGEEGWISAETVERWLACAAPPPDDAAGVMAMPYLSGAECSVDVLAEAGRLLGAVVRRKTGTAQVIEHRPEARQMARTLVAGFNLSGLVNVQMIDDHAGTPRLLEINARMSGGLTLSAQSGVDLFGGFCRLVAGDPAEAVAADLAAAEASLVTARNVHWLERARLASPRT